MGEPEAFLVLNADIMGDYPLLEFVEFHRKHAGEHSILATEVRRVEKGCDDFIVKVIFKLCWKCGGLVVSALDSRCSSPGSSPSQEGCDVLLGKTRTSGSASFHPGVQMGTGKFNSLGNHAMNYR